MGQAREKTMKRYVVFAAILLGGCTIPYPYTETPLATNFETSKQKKLQSAHHWQVIANDLADSIDVALNKGRACIPSAGTCQSVSVTEIKPRTEFTEALQTAVLTRLVSKGRNVLKSKGEIEVSIEAQTVEFSPERSQYLGAGLLTQLATGVWAIHAAIHNAATNTGLAPWSDWRASVGPYAAVTVAATAAYDIYQWNKSEFAKGPTPKMEVIVTASATQGDKYLGRVTNVYYIADTDAELYLRNKDIPVFNIKLVGDKEVKNEQN